MKFIVTGIDIMHNKKLYPEGSEIELRKEEADNLGKYLQEKKETANPSGTSETKKSKNIIKEKSS